MKLNYKTPSGGTCLGEPPGGFCDVGCCCFLPHWRFLAFILALFHATGTPPRLRSFHSICSELYPGYFRLLALMSFLPRVLRNFKRRFYLRRFLPCTLFADIYVRLCGGDGAGHPDPDPPLCLLS